MPPGPMCKDYKNCSLPTEKQTAAHKLRSHAAPKVPFVNPSTHIMVDVERDPTYDMYYVCTSDECPYKSFLSSNPRAHFRECKFVLQDHQRKYPWLFKSSSDPSGLSGSSRRYTRIKPIGNATADTAAAASSGANARELDFHYQATARDGREAHSLRKRSGWTSQEHGVMSNRNSQHGEAFGREGHIIIRASQEHEGAPFIISGLSEASSVYSACTRDTPSLSIDSQNLPADSDEEHEIKATITENIMGEVADQD
ncbi:hypothetical protein BC939DRAFT_499917 [Gamsiella multidivaricata]|uniref:uncharacterized protein n=1 Tax=Gamsiella multidivaricata TaxID=101098 RepID=UPI00221FB550|nr:uncharacterized protein BC939DRAFT_499917 [Gamsiella multidivaricata]KAI7829794.1 hypothetical protein BC939DRAFT_499917 [Gamsiella multidivaricata]